jgi:hypothetical protein
VGALALDALPSCGGALTTTLAPGCLGTLLRSAGRLPFALLPALTLRCCPSLVVMTSGWRLQFRIGRGSIKRSGGPCLCCWWRGWFHCRRVFRVSVASAVVASRPIGGGEPSSFIWAAPFSCSVPHRWRSALFLEAGLVSLSPGVSGVGGLSGGCGSLYWWCGFGQLYRRARFLARFHTSGGRLCFWKRGLFRCRRALSDAFGRWRRSLCSAIVGR